MNRKTRLKLKKVPHFREPGNEAEYWERHSASEYRLFPVDVDEVLQELAARYQRKYNVTIRLESELTKRLKKRAKRAGVRYQTFVREWLWRAVA